MSTEAGDKKTGTSYLSTAVGSLNPWAANRPSSPAPARKSEETPRPSPAIPVDPGDHSITHLYGQSFRTYPPDCPTLDVQWFHAVDVPKRTAKLAHSGSKPKDGAKEPSVPRKYSAFSSQDSQALEARYQKLLEATEERSHQPPNSEEPTSNDAIHSERREDRSRTVHHDSVRVPVNEDYLFDVNIEQRELSPVYWLGPVYEVRRGTWFYQEGSQLRPCEENLASQLEEGYLKLKPWLHEARPRAQSGTHQQAPETSKDNLRTTSETVLQGQSSPMKASKASLTVQKTSAQPQSHRLFGTYMNNVATYQDAKTAWLSSDTMLSWVTSSVYEKFAGGGYMSGIKLTRGYTEPTKAKDKGSKEKNNIEMPAGIEQEAGSDERQQRLLKRRSAPPTTGSSHEQDPTDGQPSSDGLEGRQARLQRQLSSLIEGDGRTVQNTEEELQRQEEMELQDYHTQAGESQGRQIDHLILVTHGIGQQLSLRMDSINFIHDVNALRKTLKSTYANSADLKALNSELQTEHGNCRVQVLPVCWRHLLNFPKQREKQAEHDLGSMNEEEDAYPSLEDITVEGVAFARSLISDLALDVLLYQSSYRERISKIVLEECNRIFKLYQDRNPSFCGKVHVMGHSLGSAILFDILCRQKSSKEIDSTKSPLRIWPTHARSGSAAGKEKGREWAFDFDVEDLYCLGSPIGLFQMLEGRTIAARSPVGSPAPGRTENIHLPADPFLAAPMTSDTEEVSPVTGLPNSVSAPNIKQLFNVFHPSDPISYRLEPLISPAMKQLKPQGLPYTKKGILNVANQGLTGIGAKVGQSVSGLWSSFSAGIANNMLNRSLGLTSDEVAQIADQVQLDRQRSTLANEEPPRTAAKVPSDSPTGESMDERKKQLADVTQSGALPNTSGHDPTLIDDELETLFSQFQKRRSETGTEGGDVPGKAQDELRKVSKMRTEESKVRALNRNGRVDYSIQESVLDFNPINTIASHMAYWTDADVNHFVLSQLLSGRQTNQYQSSSSRGEIKK